jgi:hypothetical protein
MLVVGAWTFAPALIRPSDFVIRHSIALVIGAWTFGTPRNDQIPMTKVQGGVLSFGHWSLGLGHSHHGVFSQLGMPYAYFEMKNGPAGEAGPFEAPDEVARFRIGR